MIDNDKYEFDFYGLTFGIKEYDDLKKHFEEKYADRIPKDFYEELFNLALTNEAKNYVKNSQEDFKKKIAQEKRKTTLAKKKTEKK